MATEVVTEAVVPAPLARVWEVLVDTAAYSQWNPVIRGLRPRRALVAGAPARLTLALDERLPPLRIAVRLRCVDHRRQLSWVGGLPGLARGHHYFRIAAIDDETTRLVHGEAFDGMIAAGLWPLAARALTARYEALNQAIAGRCAALG